ncbi:MAG: hypothetical protein P4L31_04240 [Candidatus Babeliales bacterium]|nr:hypothetical protein [Candidatus Babeliales bacterium]
MKSQKITIFLIINAWASLYASQDTKECAPQPYVQMPSHDLPSAPPSYQSLPPAAPLITDNSIRKADRQTHSRVEFLALMLSIYQDSSIKETIRSRYPHLTAEQLLENTRNEKKEKMDRDGKMLLRRYYPKDSEENLTQVTKKLQTTFFSEQISKQRSGCSCFCCYKNYIMGASGESEKWNLDEPNCCHDTCTIQ